MTLSSGRVLTWSTEKHKGETLTTTVSEIPQKAKYAVCDLIRALG